MVQLHKTKVIAKREQTEVEETPATPIKDKHLDADTLDLLDEIDAALGDLTEAEVETMVKEYVQKGGQ